MSNDKQNNGRTDYERLRLGMTQVEVESILGRGIEIERSRSASFAERILKLLLFGTTQTAHQLKRYLKMVNFAAKIRKT